MEPLVSIVIACFNYGRYLAEAVDSALAQSYGPIEVIIADDGSTDNTRAVAESYGARVRYLPLRHAGQGATLNAALAEARGDYYVCLDADNALAPAYVEKTLRVLRACTDPDVAFVYTQRQFFGDTEGVFCPPAYDVARLKRRNYIDMCALVRTSEGRQAGYATDPALAPIVDYDFYLRLAERGRSGILLEEPLVRYRIHGTSISAQTRQRYGQLKLALALIRRHPALYNGREARDAMAEARGRVQLAIVNNRRPDSRLSQRLRDLAWMARARPALALLYAQVRYTLSPR